MAVATDELTFLVRQNISASIYSTCWGRGVGFFNPKLCIRELTDRAVRGMTLSLRHSFGNLLSFPILCDMHLHSAKCLHTCVSVFSNPTTVNETSVCNCKCLLDKGYQIHCPLERHRSLCTDVN